jgi:hypothetical protein
MEKKPPPEDNPEDTALRLAFITISQARTCSATRRKVHGGKIITAVSNGDQVNRVAALAMKRGKSVDFTGYWQRHIAA